MLGGGDGEFFPDEPVTREQLAVMLCRFSGEANDAGEDGETLWEDADKVSPWAVESLEWAARRGLITGKTESTIDPLDDLTRAEAAVIAMRFSKMNAE